MVPGSNPLTTWPSDAVASGAWGTSGNGPANPQELNRYSYALNNPLKYTDPTGHCADPVTATMCAVGGAALIELLLTVAPGAAVYGVGQVALASDVPDETVSSVGGAEGLPTGDTVPADLHVFPQGGGRLRQREGKEYEVDDDGMVVPQAGLSHDFLYASFRFAEQNMAEIV